MSAAREEELSMVNGGLDIAGLIKGDYRSPKFSRGDRVWIKSLSVPGMVLEYADIGGEFYYWVVAASTNNEYWISEHELEMCQ